MPSATSRESTPAPPACSSTNPDCPPCPRRCSRSTKVVDAILAAPEETYADLVFTASRKTRHAMPIHPLLTGDDTPSAIQLFNALRTAAVRARVDRSGHRHRSRNHPARLRARHQCTLKELTGSRRCRDPRSAGPCDSVTGRRQRAQSIIQRLRRELPLREKLVVPERMRPRKW
jgi:hypothetical protein